MSMSVLCATLQARRRWRWRVTVIKPTLSAQQSKNTMVKKGEYPERPPTLAEALYQGKDLGTRPANADQILKDLGMSNPKTQSKTKTTSTAPSKKLVSQVDAHMSTPLPSDAPAKIEANYILPEQCEAVTNLQMDYILLRKSTMIRTILSSRVFSSGFFGITTIIAYRYIGEYFSEYTFKKGVMDGLYQLFGNSYFKDDLFVLFFIIMIILATAFTSMKFITAFLQQESVDVPKNFQKYFNVDLNQYATLSNVDKSFNKLNKIDKDLVKTMRDNTLCIVYREAPVAFMSVTPDKDANIKITGYGVRRVYIKAELLKDLLSMLFKRFVLTDSPVENITVDLYSFEKTDIDLFKRAGFYRCKKNSLGFLISTIFGITRDTYIFEKNSVEF